MLENTGLERLPHAEFAFATDAEGASAWRVVRFKVAEFLSGQDRQFPYRASVELVSEDPFADPFILHGSSCTLSIGRGSEVLRRVHGIAEAVSLLGSKGEGRNVRATVEIAPALACLAHGKNYRRFQGRAVPEILKDLLTVALAPYQREVELRLSRSVGDGDNRNYLPRDLCVQRGESDYHFARRLMEEEGISMFFEDGGEREKLILLDTNTTFPKIYDHAAVRIVADPAMVPTFEAIAELSLATRTAPTAVALRTFDATRPSVDLSATAKTKTDDDQDVGLVPARGREEIYDFGDRIVLAGYKDRAYRRIDVEAKARIRLEEMQARRIVGRGSSSITGFAAGYTFRLDTGSAALDRDYLITRIEHEGEDPEAAAFGTAPVSERAYRNTFECTPSTVAFRPEPSTPKPHATFDLAVVTGPADTEDDIYVDEHGRIRVNFVWNREDLETTSPDETRSCWVPVAQGWLGSRMGMQVIPRRGMQVLVAYLDGDPDRPLVVQCVETALCQLPYELPEHKTRSVFFRTRTSPPNEKPKENEVSTEDAAGKEELLVHAGRDLTTRVDHDERRTVGSRQTVLVKGGREDTVEKDETRIVQGNRVAAVKGDHTRSTEGEETNVVRKNQTNTVDKSRTTSIGEVEKGTFAGGRVEEVQGEDKLHVTETLHVVGDKEVKIEQGPTSFRMSSTNVEVKADGSVEITNPGARVFVDREGNVTVHGEKKISLSAGAGASAVLGDGKIALSAETEATIAVGGSEIKVDAAGVTVSGNTITESAAVMHQTTATIITQN